MAYNYKKASDLVEWAKVQLNNPNYYQNGGIGRYDGKYRIFDCCGLFKCFMWHDYPNNDGPACYDKTQKDYNCEQLIAEAKEKGDISTIPEIPGVLVYQYGHMGIYIGNGEVIESTAAKFDGKNSKIYKTYFKGNHNGYRRATWTHWFKSPNLIYDEPKPLVLKYNVGNKVIVNGSLYVDSKGNGKGKLLSDYIGVITITNNDYNTTKPYHIDDLGWVSETDLQLYVEPPKEEPIPIEPETSVDNESNNNSAVTTPLEEEKRTTNLFIRLIQFIISIIKKLVS